MNPYPLLQGRLQVRRLRVHRVAGHGNSCQFRALAYALGIGVDQHFYLRLNLVMYIQLHPAEFAGFIPENNIHAYCDRMRGEGVCGDNLTLQAAADLYGVDIVLVRADGPEETTTINGRSGQRGSINLIFYPEPDDNRAGHYDATDPIGQAPLEEEAVEVEEIPLLRRWNGGYIGSETQRRSEALGQGHTLVYANRNNDPSLTERILNTLLISIPNRLHCPLARFFAYGQGSWLYIYIFLNYSAYGDGSARLGTERNARFIFKDQFDLIEERLEARLFPLFYYPHPDAVEWNLRTLTPMQRQGTFDGRTLRKRRPEESSQRRLRPRRNQELKPQMTHTPISQQSAVAPMPPPQEPNFQFNLLVVPPPAPQQFMAAQVQPVPGANDRPNLDLPNLDLPNLDLPNLDIGDILNHIFDDQAMLRDFLRDNESDISDN